MTDSLPEAASSQESGFELRLNISPARDLRIDLARGIALLFIFIDHIDFNPAAQWTLRRYWFIDAFDLFVFLSGYSLGLVYSRQMNRGGPKVCLAKALKRCRTLYVWHIITALVFFGLLFGFVCAGVRKDAPELYTLLNHPWPACLWLFTLVHTPHLLNILPLYTVPETTKTTADPVRFLNLIVFLVAARAVVNRLQLHHKAVFRPVILCGQNALPVFATGLFLSDLFTLSGSAGHGGPIYWTVINLTGVSALLLVAKLASRVNRQPLVVTGMSAAGAMSAQGGKRWPSGRRDHPACCRG